MIKNSFGHLFLNVDIDKIKRNGSCNSIIAANNEKWFYYYEHDDKNINPNKNLSNFSPFIFFELRENYNKRLSFFDKSKKILSLDFTEGRFSIPSVVIELFLKSGEPTLTDELFETFKKTAIEKIESSQRLKDVKKELFSFDFNKLKSFNLSILEINKIQQLLNFINFKKLYLDYDDKINIFEELIEILGIKNFDLHTFSKAMGFEQNFKVL